jgi:uncharacterized RDD family membrane protein YckC
VAVMSAPAGWYPDPAGSPSYRFFDGVDWTEHLGPPPIYIPPTSGLPGYGWQPTPPWKGAQYGLPAEGPGSLADPGRRLGARVLDGLLLLGAWIVISGITLLLLLPHVGPIFPKVNSNPNATTPTPGFLWIYVALLCCGVFMLIAAFFYEAVATARYGRTLGKAWLHIRPVRLDGSKPGWGCAFGRAAIYGIASFLGWIGWLDSLWCLWDPNQQCLHDKAASTLVIEDPLVVEPSPTPTETSGATFLVS